MFDYRRLLVLLGMSPYLAEKGRGHSHFPQVKWPWFKLCRVHLACLNKYSEICEIWFNLQICWWNHQVSPNLYFWLNPLIFMIVGEEVPNINSMNMANKFPIFIISQWCLDYIPINPFRISELWDPRKDAEQCVSSVWWGCFSWCELTIQGDEFLVGIEKIHLLVGFRM